LMRAGPTDERRFPDAQAFDPARWLSGSSASSAKRVAMPFGAGPRLCPGRYLAMLEMKMVMAMLLGGFDIESVAAYGEADRARLLADAGIIRNRAKIEAAIGNAKAFLTVQKEFGSFDAYIWRFAGRGPKTSGRRTLKQIPARTKESDQMSEALKRRDFRFVGSTICYAYMQAVGMVNDHLTYCFRSNQRADNQDRPRPGGMSRT